MDKLERQVVFKDPVYGYIHINYQIIRDLIDSPLFQRLRRIKQLSGVMMVFHGAEHSRFSHSLGVYELANRTLAEPDLVKSFSSREQLLFLCASLLHDVGHGAYSHAFEDVFSINHEQIGASIIMNDATIHSILCRVDKNFPKDISSILLKKHKFPLIEQLLSSQVDIDRMDYLERDAYFTGTAYGHIDVDRLIRSMRIIDKKVVFKYSGIHAIENYLIARYHMYWQVYYHPVARTYEVILEKIYLRIKDLISEGYVFSADITPIKRVIDNVNDLEAYLEIDDYYINGLIKAFIHSDDFYLRTLSSDFLNRNIWERIDVSDDNKEFIDSIISHMNKNDARYFTSSRTVTQSTYRDSGEVINENVFILSEDGTISNIKKQSKIINSLIHAGNKKDLKFFYRNNDSKETL